MLTPNPMPTAVLESLDGEMTATQLSTSSTSSPNEADLFSKQMAEIFDELVEEYRIASSIRENGKEDGRNMLVFLKAGLEKELDDLIESTVSGIARKFLEAVVDSLDGLEGVLDKEPEKVFESMICRIMSMEVLQQPLKLLSDHLGLFLANPPASILDRDMDRYKKQQAYLSKALEVFDDVDYQSDPVHLMKIMEEQEPLGPLPPKVISDLDVLKIYGDQKY